MNSDPLEAARRRRWAAHCHGMAEATHALADWCDDPEMIRGYLELAARWIKMAELAPAPEPPGAD